MVSESLIPVDEMPAARKTPTKFEVFRLLADRVTERLNLARNRLAVV